MKTTLSELCNGYSKNIALKDLINNNGTYPIYGASGYIKNVDFYVSDCDYLGIVKDGAGIGRVDKYPAYSSLLGTMQYIVPNADVDIDYLKYLLISLHLENGVSSRTRTYDLLITAFAVGHNAELHYRCAIEAVVVGTRFELV